MLKNALTELLAAEPIAVALTLFFSGIMYGYVKSYCTEPLFKVDTAPTRKISSGPCCFKKAVTEVDPET